MWNCHRLFGAGWVRGFVLVFGILLGQAASAAVSLSVLPAAISNQYIGSITFQIGGLTNGETVFLEKYLDANTNGIVDAADWLSQGLKLTDGSAMIIGGVTNFNVPGDLDSTPGTITARYNLSPADLSQEMVGRYVFRLSSPTGRFAPVTALFSITNSGFKQSFSGTVRSGGTNVPYAGVMLFLPSSGGGGMNAYAGTVADGAGSFKLTAPPGTYLVWAFKSNYVADLSSAAPVTLGAGATVTANPSLVSATRLISGRVVDAGNTSKGVPVVLLPCQSDAGQIAVGFTDTNGNFTVPVVPGQWKIKPDDVTLASHGYLRLQQSPQVDTTTGNATGVVIAVPKATALFYGVVQDTQDRRLPGLWLYVDDNNNQYEGDALTDINGNYVLGVVAGNWNLGVDNSDPAYADYVFTSSSQMPIQSGQALAQNFTGMPAPYTISGDVKDTQNNPVANVGVYAYATVNGQTFNQYVDTDGSGHYQLSVGNGAWQVGLNCNGGSDSLSQYGYQCVNNQTVTIANGNGTANFSVSGCSGVQITTTSLPDAQVNTYYSYQLQASGCGQSFTWSLSTGSNPLPSGMNLSSDGTLNGQPMQSGTFSFSARVTDGQNTADRMFSLTISGGQPLQVMTSFLPNATQGVQYQTQLTASGGQMSYSWSLAPGSAPLPPNLTLSADGAISGIPTTNGVYYFFARVTDATRTFADQMLSLTINNVPVSITTMSLPSGLAQAPYYAQLAVSGGQSPYRWSLAVGSAALPPGLTLGTDGTISGTATTAGDFYFIVRVDDAALASAVRPLEIVVNGRPRLSLVQRVSPTQFLLGVSGVRMGQACTIQISTDLAHWSPVGTTNAPGSTFTFPVPATGNAAFYRLVAGP